MKITWLTQGGFLFESAQFRIIVDPYMSDTLSPKMTRLTAFPIPLNDLAPSAVLCTHDHLDHLDPETIGMIRGKYPQCVYGGTQRAHAHFAQLGVSEPLLLEIYKAIRLGPFSITPVFANHSDPSAAGFVIRSNGRKVYLTGDTEYDERLFSHETEDSDLLLICINGRLGNMTWQQAHQTALRLRSKTALPMHYGLFAENTEHPTPFIKGCLNSGIRSFEMAPGEEFDV